MEQSWINWIDPYFEKLFEILNSLDWLNLNHPTTRYDWHTAQEANQSSESPS